MTKEKDKFLDMLGKYGQLQDRVTAMPRNYEFGANIDENEKIYQKLLLIRKYLNQLHADFDLMTVSLADANHFFHLSQQTTDLIEKFDQLIYEPFGSYQNTRELKNAFVEILEELEFAYNWYEKREPIV